MTQWWAPTIVRVSGDSTMRGQLLQTTDGSLICNFPERMILIANHQIYTDWLYLWWIGYAAGMHGRIYVVLKESLKRIPVIGWGMQFAQFIFLKRKWEQDKPRMAAHLQKFNNPKDPMWLMMFPEGTNLADSTREASKQWAERNGIQDMRHTLLPRSTGLQFILQELRKTVEYVYDCTIAYEGVPRGEFAQDIFTVGASYFGGQPPKSVNMYWRRFRIADIPLDNPKLFEMWLRQRWTEKDKFIEDYLRTGRFPADKGSSKDSKGQNLTGAGHIEAEIKPKYWYEFLQVFAPIGLFALVLYMFYGALPNEVLNKIKSIDQKTVLRQIRAYQRGEIKIPDQNKLRAVATKALQDQQKSGGSKFRNAALARGVVTLNGVPQKDFPAKGLGKKDGTQVTKRKRVSPKTGSSTKAPSKLKTVTLNGVPVKDFAAKGLGDVAGVSEVLSIPTEPNTAIRLSLDTSSTLVKTPILQKSKVNGTPSKQLQSQAQKKASTKKPAARQATAPVVNNTTDKKQVAQSTHRTTSNRQRAVSRNLATKPSAHTASNDLAMKPKTQSSETPEAKQVESVDVRKARKKLELRQGRQEPKRKTRRALEGPAAAS